MRPERGKMLNVGEPLPAFRVNAFHPGNAQSPFAPVSNEDLRGQWAVLFSVPFAFTTVCPTEVAQFAAQAAEFAQRGARLFMFSMDSEYVLQAWLAHEPLLRGVQFACLADFKRELSTALDVVHKGEGCPLRATLVVDPDGVVRHTSCYDLNQGRSVHEVLRTLDALQSGGMTACEWKRGDKLLH